jgi:melanoma-associated antigen
MYILRSTLDPLIIEYAAQTDEAILAEEAIDLHDDANDNNEEFGLGTYGSIISWSSADELAVLGILHVILTLILVNGRVVTDGPSVQFFPDQRWHSRL